MIKLSELNFGAICLILFSLLGLIGWIADIGYLKAAFVTYMIIAAIVEIGKGTSQLNRKD